MVALVFAPTSTKRLRLRSLTGTDATAVLRILDPAMLDFLPPNLTRASVAKFLCGDGDLFVGAFDGREDVLFGVLGLHVYPAPSQSKRLELSYLIARRATGNGLAAEAAKDLIGFAERTYSTSVVAQVRGSNLASQRVLAKLGFFEAKDEVSAERGYRLMEKSVPPSSNEAAQ